MTDAPLTTPQFLAGATPGAQLRQAREAAGLALPAVSQALHLTVHYIKALENDEYNKLPGLIFVKGYIRAYARFLKLDVEALLASYDRYVQTLPEIKSHTLAGNYTRKRNDQAIMWAGAATVVILIGMVTGWWLFGGAGEPQKTVQQYTTVVQAPPATTVAATGDNAIADTTAADGNAAAPATATSDHYEQNQNPTAPAVAMPSPASAAAVTTADATPVANQAAIITPGAGGGRQINLQRDGSDQLQVSFGGNSWIEINDYASTRIYADMLHSGDVLMIKGKAPFQVLLGDARNVKATFNAVPVTISVRSDSTARFTLADKNSTAAGVSH